MAKAEREENLKLHYMIRFEMHTAVNQLHMVSKAWVLSRLQTAPYRGSLDPYCEGNLILNAQVNRGL